MLFKSKRKLVALPLIVASLLLVLIYIFVNEAAQFTQSTYTGSSQHVFDRVPCVLVFVYSILASLGTSFLIRDHLFAKLFGTFYDHFAAQIKENGAEYRDKILNNDLILSQGEQHLMKEK